MEIGIKIIDIDGTELAIFDKDFFELDFSEFLDGIGNGSFKVSTQSKMLQLLVPTNIIEVVDLGDNDRVIWRGFIRPFTVSSDIAEIQLTEIKDRLNYSILETNGTVTNITQALIVTGFPYILNMPEITFVGIEYRIGMKVYNVLEEIRKATSYDWSFDGNIITFGRVGIDRTDIEFWSEATPGSCNDIGGALFIDNIKATFVERYDKVIAYNPSVGLAIAGNGKIEIAIDSNSTSITDLQKVADEKLKLGSNRRVITFDVPNIGNRKINVGDRIFAEISSMPDIFLVTDSVIVLKKETRLENCSLLTKLFISETKVGLKNNFNIFAGLDAKISNLQTR